MARILLHHSRLPAALSEEAETRWLASLPSARRAQLLRRRQRSDRIASLLGIALLRDCATAAGLAPPHASDLVWPARGKPRWPGGPDFSIAHAGQRVACALLATTGGNVGLDLERDDAVSWEQLRFVTVPREVALYRAAGLSAAALWTAKEAVLKASGRPATDAAEVLVMHSVARFGDRHYLLRRPRIASGWSCCVALTAAGRVSPCSREALALLALSD